MRLHNKLRLYVLRKCRGVSNDLAEDAASDAICGAIAANSVNWSYCARSAYNYVLQHWRNRATRNENYSLPEDENGMPIEPPSAAVRPLQHIRITATECAVAIGELTQELRDVMIYAAKEYSIEEIASVLDIRPDVVRARLLNARRILRERDFYEIGRERGHHKYIGIRKRHHIWEARIKNGNKNEHIGFFDTAIEAAVAFDVRARELMQFDTASKTGPKRKLNFA